MPINKSKEIDPKAKAQLAVYLKTKEGSAFAHSIFNNVLQSAFKYLEIDPRGKTNAEMHSDIVKFVQDFKDKKRQVTTLTVDYRSTLLKEARKYHKSNSVISCILYATWLEHWVNHLIHVLCIREKLIDSEVNQILRETSIRGKLTWVLKLLHLPAIRNNHINNIHRLLELRNSFVHYKWNALDDIKDKNQKDSLIKCLKGIERTVRYVRNYEILHVMHGMKIQIPKDKLKFNI